MSVRLVGVLGVAWLGCPAPADGLFPCDLEARCPGRLACEEASWLCSPTAECAAPLTPCGVTCTSLAADSRNCGACGSACAASEDCVAGRCVPPSTTTSCDFCGPGVACSDGACDCEGRGQLCTIMCVDAQQSAVSCGSCFAACSATGTACRGGNCVCPPGQRVCGAACIDVTGDRANCGDCGRACPASEKCERGACVASCSVNAADACRDGRCWDVTADARRCGASCARCRAGQVCDAGACQCPAGTTLCGTTCVDAARDLLNCGACGTPCAAGETCAAGQCTCQPGLAKCGAACVLLSGDVANCGACGVACAPGQSCVSGRCGGACPLGATECGGVCPDTGRDVHNCGGCANACNAGELCIDGSCARITPAVGCAACPCDTCDFGRGWLCCTQRGAPQCVDAMRCPP